MPRRVRGIHARNAVELREQRRRRVQVRRPVGRFAADAVSGAQRVRRAAAVPWLQGVDGHRLYTHADRRVGQLGRVLALDDLADDLGGDDVVRDAVRDLARVVLGGQEAQQAVVHGEEVPPVLPRVVQPLARDLRELAAAVEARGRERVVVRRAHLPVDLRGRSVGARRAVVEERRVRARPAVCLAREGVCRVGRAFVVPVDLLEEGVIYFAARPRDARRGEERARINNILKSTYHLDILQLKLARRHHILLGPNMRHIAPIICAVARGRRRHGRIEDKPIHAGPIDHLAEIVDGRGVGRIPGQINARGI